MQSNPVEDILQRERVLSVSATGSFSQEFDYEKNAEQAVDDIRQSLPEEFRIERIYDEQICFI